jgi:hypothetical protein
MSEVKRFKPVINSTPYKPYAYCEENEDGIYVRIDDYEALQAERNALAAENAALIELYRQSVNELDDTCFEIGMMRGEKSMEYPAPETPATDAYLNSVRAEGVEALTKILQVMIDAGDFDGDEVGAITGAIDAGNYHATQLRACKDGE